MAKTLVESVSETLTPPRRRWMPWRRKTLTERVGERIGDVTDQMGGTASDMIERARARTVGLAQRSGAQVFPAAGNVQRRAAFQAGKMVGRFSGRRALAPAAVTMLPGEVPGGQSLSAVPWYGAAGSAADLSAERAADAAEVAADAAQRAVGLLERVGGWVGLLANRAAQPGSDQPPVAQTTPVSKRAAKRSRREAVIVPAAELTPEEAAASGGMMGTLKRAALTAGERINEWSDGRYGLEPQKPEKHATKAQKKAIKRRERLMEQAAKEAERTSGVSWLPWAVGLSLGLVVGLVGVAYWQRRRLQELWGETSQRMQQATENVRQRFEANRGPISQTVHQDVPPGTPNFRSLGSAAPATDLDEQRNGRLESASQEGRP